MAKATGGVLPVTVSRNDIVNPQFLADLFDAQMQSVGLELFACHVGHNSGRKAHEAGCFVLRGIAPSVALLATARTIGFGSYHAG